MLYSRVYVGTVLQHLKYGGVSLPVWVVTNEKWAVTKAELGSDDGSHEN